jgi:hypothetical protein
VVHVATALVGQPPFRTSECGVSPMTAKVGVTRWIARLNGEFRRERQFLLVAHCRRLGSDGVGREGCRSQRLRRVANGRCHLGPTGAGVAPSLSKRTVQRVAGAA